MTDCWWYALEVLTRSPGHALFSLKYMFSMHSSSCSKHLITVVPRWATIGYWPSVIVIGLVDLAQTIPTWPTCPEMPHATMSRLMLLIWSLTQTSCHVMHCFPRSIFFLTLFFCCKTPNYNNDLQEQSWSLTTCSLCWHVALPSLAWPFLAKCPMYLRVTAHYLPATLSLPRCRWPLTVACTLINRLDILQEFIMNSFICYNLHAFTYGAQQIDHLWNNMALTIYY